MRILAGQLKGRLIHRPKTTTVRPLGDKMRAALFNIIGPLDGLTVLDAYAGSGAVGFEALSRGAARVIAVEGSRAVAKTIQRSVVDLGVAHCYSLVVRRIESWVEPLLQEASRQQFNLIVADPPYAQLNPDVLSQLGRLLAAGGELVVSHSSRISPPELQSVQLEQTRQYGDSSLSFYGIRGS